MAGSSRALTLKLLADIENFTKGLNSADNHVTTFGEKVADYGKKAALAFAAVGAAAIAASVDMVKNAAADEAAQRTLAKTLENTTNATKAQVAAVEDYITKTSLAKGVTDDELRPAFARITRSTKDLEESQKLLNLAMDISAATGKPLEAIANSLGKAYDGNTNALGRLGLGIDQSVLKTKDFNLVYENLRGSFKGFAEQEANTFEGKLRRLQIAFDEGKETIGSYILTAITPMVETIVNRVIPAIADFTDNLGEKLRPVIQFLTPITDGLRKAFNTVRDSLKENSAELQPLLNLFKAIAAFARDVLAPVLSKVLGKAFEVIGTAISGLITALANVVTFFNNLYNAIKRVVDLAKSLGNLNPFSGGSTSKASPTSAPSTPTTPSGIPSHLNIRPISTTNITVNGAIDSESAARQIVSILNDSTARGTLGSAAFV